MTERYLEFGEPADDSRGGERTLSIREVLNALRRHWLVAFCVLTAVVALGMYHTLRQPRLYEASTTVRIGVQQAPLAGMPSSQVYDYRVDRLQSEQQVIRSQEVAERVVADLGLRLDVARPVGLRRSDLFGATPVVDSTVAPGDYRLVLRQDTYELRRGDIAYGAARYRDTLRAGGMTLFVPARPSIDGDEVILSVTTLTNAALALRGGIGTRMLPQTDIVEVRYTGTDPKLTRDIANAIAQAYARWTMEGNRRSAQQKSTFIAQQLDEQEARLAAAQDALKNFKERNRISSATAEATALFESINAFEAEKQNSVVEQNVYQELLGKLAEADTLDQDLRQLASTEAIAKNTYVAGLYTRWFDLQQKREELLSSQNRTPLHPDVQAVDRLITRTKLDLQEASRSYLRGIQSRIGSLERSIADLRATGAQYPALQAEESRLQANVTTAQATFQALQGEYNLARIAEEADGGTVRVLDVAQLPTFAISPNRRRALMMYLALGFLLAVAAAVVVESLDNTVKSPEELTARFELPVLGLIPVIKQSDAGTTESGPALTRLVTHADPRSPVAEAYRSLRTNIAYARAHQDLRTIVLTSPGPADGKSTTAANLAISFAQQGQRTLLIDADLRRAVLDGTFDVTRSPGLTDILVGNATLAEAVRTTEVPSLSVLPSGQFPPNPSELLGSPAMQNVLHDAQGMFDVVLFDTPPLLAVTDAAVLSTMVDGSILVVRMGSTTRDAVRQAALRLRNVRARVLGAVLNDMSQKAGSYYGGYGAYTYYAYYGSDGHENGRASVMDRLRRVATLAPRKR